MNNSLKKTMSLGLIFCFVQTQMAAPALAQNLGSYDREEMLAIGQKQCGSSVPDLNVSYALLQQKQQSLGYAIRTQEAKAAQLAQQCSSCSKEAMIQGLKVAGIGAGMIASVYGAGYALQHGLAGPNLDSGPPPQWITKLVAKAKDTGRMGVRFLAGAAQTARAVANSFPVLLTLSLASLFGIMTGALAIITGGSYALEGGPTVAKGQALVDGQRDQLKSQGTAMARINLERRGHQALESDSQKLLEKLNTYLRQSASEHNIMHAREQIDLNQLTEQDDKTIRRLSTSLQRIVLFSAELAELQKLSEKLTKLCNASRVLSEGTVSPENTNEPAVPNRTINQ